MTKLFASALALMLSHVAFAQASVSAHIDINQPGIYGRIDIGQLPSVAIVQPQPIIVAPAPVYVEQPPIYLYVPPAHQQNWRRYCGQYHACGQRVYFVREEWVRERYQEEHPDWHHGEKHNHGHDKETSTIAASTMVMTAMSKAMTKPTHLSDFVAGAQLYRVLSARQAEGPVEKSTAPDIQQAACCVI